MFWSSSGRLTATSRTRLRARHAARASASSSIAAARIRSRARRVGDLRRQRGPADRVVVDAARSRDARVPDDVAAARRESSCAWWRPTSAAASGKVRDVSGRGDPRRLLPAAAAADQMDRGSARAFPRRHPGARSVLGPRGGVRQRRAPPRRAREMLHDEGAYTPQGINLPYNASTALPARTYCRPINSTCGWPRPTRSPPCRCAARAIRKVHLRWSGCSTASPTSSVSSARSAAPQSRAPEKMPYVSPLKTRAGSPVALDSGDFRPASAWCSKRSTTPASPRQRHARREGRYLGLGLGNGVKGTGRGPFDPASCASAAPDAFPSPARCPWGKDQDRAGADLRRAVRRRAGQRRGRRRRYRGHSLRSGRLRQPTDGDRRLRRSISRQVAVRDKALKVAAHLLEVA